MKRVISVLVVLMTLSVWKSTALLAFCGFYVAKADTKLFNKASQVVLVRDGDRTVLTMANDFKGDPKEFAVVIPVPTVPAEGADPRRREGAARSPRRLFRAAAGRVLRRGSVPPICNATACCRWQRRCRSRPPRRQRAREEPRRHHRGAVHRRRVRHPDPVGQAEQRPRDVAARERLPDSRRAHRSARPATSEQNMQVLRRQGEPDGTGEAGFSVPAAAAGGLRVAEVHAADPARHGERRRPAGTVRLRADAQRPRRDDELPHGEAADRHGRADLCEDTASPTSTRRCSRIRSRRRT